MKATKKNLKDQILIKDEAIMICLECDSQYSANSGDYWNVPDNHVFKCCGLPMELVIKSIVYTSI